MSQLTYPYAQEKFSRARRAQRKFRVEPVRSAAKLARSNVDSSEEVMYSAQTVATLLWFRTLIC